MEFGCGLSFVLDVELCLPAISFFLLVHLLSLLSTVMIMKLRMHLLLPFRVLSQVQVDERCDDGLSCDREGLGMQEDSLGGRKFFLCRVFQHHRAPVVLFLPWKGYWMFLPSSRI